VVVSAIVDLNRPPRVVHWHFIHLSSANVIVIVATLVLFIAAVALPFPPARQRRRSP
jgi:hypothetical protein